ncbi:methytransferase partner Trm112 [Methanonatronarchaeum sp. AMET-Sl]|uniref:methytransferase partner Trm112 n=1 Tax=Methanonatronarchaeum sp. AMET-Sl TaxID=3037654 RepID=UPI00244DC5F5|nr:methytransferase partner Trm112 [Methanonatronarchaeum sp. AMET-Sl]WGI17569.1 methytransferase partner Trm112 [Methanonatronarchaeum sp. AMET-Sl]
MKKKLLDKIVCPECRNPLQLKEKKVEDEKIIEGKLTCNTCNKNYPIKQGIPNLLPKNK